MRRVHTLQAGRLYKEVELGKNAHLATVPPHDQLLLQGNVEETALQLVLNLRAMYQCSLDGGSWTSAWLLTYLPDPLEKPRFGGEAQDLEIIAGYLKAMQELEKKGNKWNHQDHENEEGKGKPKGRGKHGKKEHPAEERELK